MGRFDDDDREEAQVVRTGHVAALERLLLGELEEASMIPVPHERRAAFRDLLGQLLDAEQRAPATVTAELPQAKVVRNFPEAGEVVFAGGLGSFMAARIEEVVTASGFWLRCTPVGGGNTHWVRPEQVATINESSAAEAQTRTGPGGMGSWGRR